MMPIFVKGDDVRSGTKAKARHGWLQVARESMGLKKKDFLCIIHELQELANLQYKNCITPIDQWQIQTLS